MSVEEWSINEVVEIEVKKKGSFDDNNNDIVE
jgi:hypothetical protein